MQFRLSNSERHLVDRVGRVSRVSRLVGLRLLLPRITVSRVSAMVSVRVSVNYKYRCEFDNLKLHICR